MPTTTLVFIRHGESRSNAEGWISGLSTCGGLTDHGRAQAAALRDRLALGRRQPEVILSSTMRRAVETAEIVAGPTGIAVEQLDALCERTPGECEGITMEEYRTRYGRHAYSDWVNALSPGGEDQQQFNARVRAVVAELAAAYEGQTLWIVCHGGVIMGAAALLMETPSRADAPQFFNPENASVSEWVRATADAEVPIRPWLLRRYNDHAHLDGLEREVAG